MSVEERREAILAKILEYNKMAEARNKEIEVRNAKTKVANEEADRDNVDAYVTNEELKEQDLGPDDPGWKKYVPYRHLEDLWPVLAKPIQWAMDAAVEGGLAIVRRRRVYGCGAQVH